MQSAQRDEEDSGKQLQPLLDSQIFH
jgi:hypothetical protein